MTQPEVWLRGPIADVCAAESLSRAQLAALRPEDDPTVSPSADELVSAFDSAVQNALASRRR